MFERLHAKLGLGSLLVGLANGAAPAPAHACSVSACNQGSFHLKAGASVPANAPALLWLPPRDFNQSEPFDSTLHLAQIDGTDPQEVALEVEAPMVTNGDRVVRLPKGLQAGGHYQLWVEGKSDCVPEPLELVAGDAAPLPEQLGTIVASEPERGQIAVPTTSGSCDTNLPAVIGVVDVELAAEAEPWAALFQYTTFVDDKRWFLAYRPDDLTGAQTKVYAECLNPPPTDRKLDPNAFHGGLSEGTHQLRIEATIPGSPDPLASDSVEIELQCGNPPAAEPDAGLPAMSDAGAATRDAGAADHDPPAVHERTEVQTKRTGDGSNGCAVSAPGSHIPRARRHAWIWLLSALFVFPLRARWRRRTCS